MGCWHQVAAGFTFGVREALNKIGTEPICTSPSPKPNSPNRHPPPSGCYTFSKDQLLIQLDALDHKLDP